ncbi:putative tRNA (uracil-O(2)-)-methyltransferase [Branchiostoma floridae x Branchiostoma belcheri]
MSGQEFLPEATVTRVAALQTAAQVQGFWSGVAVWVDKPHVVNRRLTGAKELARIWTNGTVISTLLQNPKVLLAKESSEGSLQKRLEELKMEGRNEAEGDDLELIVRDLLPRQLERAEVVREVIVLDHPQTRAWFVPLGVSRPDDPDSGSDLSFKSYRFVFSEDDSGTGKTIALDILSPPEASASVHSGGNCSTGGADAHSPNDDGICSPTTKWLCSHLLPKIAKWSEETVAKGNRRRVQELVPIDRYNVRYQQLKRKYGRRMIQIWPDVTTTDPEKFVYEDIAIATYLLLVWEEERMRLGLEEKQSFVDLGCGNGLLVYILAQEGHPGKGIDVRKRTTWDIYGPDTVLQEEPITPSDSCLFPDSDWLIGNHSDELTPWIPVIAARSSYTTRYFVLPCCPYDFHGRFARTHTATSHYRNYLDYIHSVGEACGFRVEEDSLRIPSTKRICQIGRTRVYPEEETHKIDKLISELISSRPREQSKNPHNSQTDIRGATTECLVGNGNALSDDPSADAKLTCDQGRSEVGGPTGSGSALWVDGFQPRSKVELVRNCNRLEEGLKDRIVNTVGLALLNQHPGNNKQINKQATGNTEFATSAGSTEFATAPESATSAGNRESATSAGNRESATGNTEAATGNTESATSAGNTESATSAGNTESVTSAGYTESATSAGNTESATSAGNTESATSAGNTESATSAGNRTWNKGGSLQMSEVVAMFDKETLQKLKCECGGLKTLLKNKNQVFILRGDSVRLRDWSLEEAGAHKSAGSTNRRRGKKKKKTDRDLRVKTSLCWFYLHHPDGCPRLAQNCYYAHGQAELRNKIGK